MTEAIRRAIQHSQESLRTLARRYRTSKFGTSPIPACAIAGAHESACLCSHFSRALPSRSFLSS